MYVINDYQLIEANHNIYLSNLHKGIKISSQLLARILKDLQNQPRLEITEEELIQLAQRYQLAVDKIKQALIGELGVIKPLLSRKFPKIYLNIEDKLISELITNTLSKEYRVECVSGDFNQYTPDSLVLFYRRNYSDADFRDLYSDLQENVYLITAGVIHNLLVIDNLFYKNSGLPSHFSNLHYLFAFLNSNIPATKNNWLLYYRELVKNQSQRLPEPIVNDCQRAYIAYSLQRFAAQYTDLWQKPMPFDQINWFWQVDLTDFHVHREVAVTSPFSEYDMDLNLSTQQSMEPA